MLSLVKNREKKKGKKLFVAQNSSLRVNFLWIVFFFFSSLFCALIWSQWNYSLKSIKRSIKKKGIKNKLKRRTLNNAVDKVLSYKAIKKNETIMMFSNKVWTKIHKFNKYQLKNRRSKMLLFFFFLRTLFAKIRLRVYNSINCIHYCDFFPGNKKRTFVVQVFFLHLPELVPIVPPIFITKKNFFLDNYCCTFYLCLTSSLTTTKMPSIKK